MRHNLKAAAVSALAIMAALAMSIPAYAAYKKISEVKFRVNAKPEAGDSIGDPDVQVTKGNVEITEQEFDNDDSDLRLDHRLIGPFEHRPVLHGAQGAYL